MRQRPAAPTPDPEIGRQLSSDLTYLRRSWQEEEFLDDDVLRRDSVILRRLLVDGGSGLLPTYRRQLGRKGPIELRAIDLKRQTDGLDRAFIGFASAGGATHNKVTVGAVLEYRQAMTDEQVRARYEAAMKGGLERAVPVVRYLDSTCLMVGGVSVSRRNVIQFIANRFGGVHFDPSRERSAERVEEQFKSLDVVMTRYEIASKNAVFFELLSIGQALVSSPQVAEFLPQPTTDVT